MVNTVWLVLIYLWVLTFCTDPFFIVILLKQIMSNYAPVMTLLDIIDFGIGITQIA